VARKSIQSQEGTEGCLTRPNGKAVVNSCGTRVGLGHQANPQARA
jgi:hypothetical protein